jgi:hypothetical protein
MKTTDPKLLEEAIVQWREQCEKRMKCNERWNNYHHLFDNFIEAIKGKGNISEKTIMCLEHVETLPRDCGEILAIDRYEKYFESRVLLAEILEVFAKDGDYMTLIQTFITQMKTMKW